MAGEDGRVFHGEAPTALAAEANQMKHIELQTGRRPDAAVSINDLNQRGWPVFACGHNFLFRIGNKIIINSLIMQ